MLALFIDILGWLAMAATVVFVLSSVLLLAAGDVLADRRRVATPLAEDPDPAGSAVVVPLDLSAPGPRTAAA